MEDLTLARHLELMQDPACAGSSFEPLDEKIHGPQHPDVVGFMHVWLRGPPFYVQHPQRTLWLTNVGGEVPE